MYSKLNELLTDYLEGCVYHITFMWLMTNSLNKSIGHQDAYLSLDISDETPCDRQSTVTDVVDIILYKQEASAIRNGFFSELYLLKVALLCCYSRNTRREGDLPVSRVTSSTLALYHSVCLFVGWSVCCLVTLWVCNWAVICRMYTLISLNVLLGLLSSSIWMCQTEPKARFCLLLERRITTLQFLPYKSYFTLNGLKLASETGSLFILPNPRFNIFISKIKQSILSMAEVVLIWSCLFTIRQWLCVVVFAESSRISSKAWLDLPHIALWWTGCFPALAWDWERLQHPLIGSYRRSCLENEWMDR